MLIYHGDMIVLAREDGITSRYLKRIYKYDGTTMTSLSGINGFGPPHDLVVANDTIYSTNWTSIVFLHNSWMYHTYDTVPMGYFEVPDNYLCSDGKAVYFLKAKLGKQYIVKLENNKRTYSNPVPSNLTVRNLVYHKNGVWVNCRENTTGRVYIGLLKGTDWTFFPAPIHRIYGTLYEFFSNLQSVNGKLYLTGMDSASGRHMILEIADVDISHITGRVYYDMDGDCIFSSGDIAMKNTVTVDNLIYASSTDGSGAYNFNVLSGSTTYVIRPQKTPYNSFNCTNDTAHLNNPQKDSSYTFDFPITMDTTKHDAAVSVGSGIVRRGFAFDVCMMVENIGWKITDTTQIELSCAQNLPIDTIKQNYPYSRKNGKLIVKIPVIDFQEDKTICTRITALSDSVSIGDTLQILVRILTSDDDNKNNFDTLYAIVRGPYDPNIKVSYPANQVDKKLERIRYTIEFQNLGNDYAKNVVVYDTVDPRMPIRYVKVTGVSHFDCYSLSVKNNVLIWTFNGIKLPAAEKDAEGSKGFICYEAMIKSGFGNPGDSIHNRATIYFDYEDGINTNRASVFVSSGGVDIRKLAMQNIHVYPNPATDRITILSGSDETVKHVSIYDIKGSLILDEDASFDNQYDVSNLGTGIYWIRVYTGNAILSGKIIIE